MKKILTFDFHVASISVANFSRCQRERQRIGQLNLRWADQSFATASIKVRPFDFRLNAVPIRPEDFTEIIWWSLIEEQL